MPKTKSDNEPGFKRYHFPENLSLTRKILFGENYSPEIMHNDDQLKAISQIKVIEILGTFPITICSNLVSLMGKDTEAENLQNVDNANNINITEYSILVIQKLFFLLNPSAFPVNKINTSRFILKICEYIILSTFLADTFEEETHNIFSFSDDETINLGNDALGLHSPGLVFSYNFIKMATLFYAYYVSLNENSIKQLNKLSTDKKVPIKNLLENVFINKSDFSYDIIPGISDELGYKTFIKTMENEIQLGVTFKNNENTINNRNIVVALECLEIKIKQEYTKIFNSWNYFIREPRILAPSGLVKLESWWKSILDEPLFYEQMCRFPSLVGRLSILNIELQSESLKSLSKKTIELYKKYKSIEATSLPPRINKILTKAEQEAELLYDVMTGRQLLHNDQNRRNSFFKSKDNVARKRRMREFYEANKDKFMKITMKHIENLTLEYSKIEREIRKDFLSQVAKDYGADKISKKEIGKWIANYRNQNKIPNNLI